MEIAFTEDEVFMLMDKVHNKVTQDFSEALRDKSLVPELLKKYHLDEEYVYHPDLDESKMKIAIISGTGNIKKEDIAAVADSLDMKANVEIYVDYTKIKHSLNFVKFKNSNIYSDIIVGELPHKVQKYNNFIEEAKSNPNNYPNIIDLRKNNTSGELHTSISNLKNALIDSKCYKIKNNII